MRKTMPWLLLAGLCLAPAVAAAPQSADDLQAKYEAKIALDFVAHGGWVTDFDKAKARAKQEDKLLFVYFSRSYAP